MRVALVLRSGGIYKAWHAEALCAQLNRHLPGVEVVCLSDLPVRIPRIPLAHGWPGWWSKMELFRPDIPGDLLYFDLDTLVAGSLSDVAACCSRPLILRDFYRDGIRRPEGLQSAMMFLPAEERMRVWGEWTQSPTRWMGEYHRGGDQAFLEKLWLRAIDLWQDVVPGQIVSYKVHCKTGAPATARVICAHGRPKLWDLPEFEHYYADSKH